MLPYPIQIVTTGNPVNAYLTTTVDKTHHGLAIAPFSMQLLQLFLLRRKCPSNQPFLLLLMICFDYAANYDTEGAFVIIFLVCSDLLNYLRSVDTIVITTESC